MRISEERIVYSQLSYQLNGLLFDVHNELGKFGRERQYADALEKALKMAGLPYAREYVIPGSDGSNKADFLVAGKILVEIKARQRIGREEYLQLMRYLRSAGLKLGILVNFRVSTLRPKRVLNSQVRE